MTTYALDNAWRKARERLSGLETVFDPGTIRHLADRGVGAGWRCLEIGGGGGSIAAWLSERVGPTGRVLATDIDTRFLEPLVADHPNLEVRRHDIAVEDLPEGAFDLVHARMVLEHLPGRDAALGRMAGALAAGGWLVVESIDFRTEAPDLAVSAAYAGLAAKLHDARNGLLASRGFDLRFARGLDRRLRSHGLGDVATEGRASSWRGGSPGTGLECLSVEQLRDAYIAGGFLIERDIANILAMLDDPDFATVSPMVLAAWGRKGKQEDG